LGALKRSKQIGFENFLIFSLQCAGCAVVGGKFSPIGEYSSTVKNQGNERWSTIAPVLKG
jgi:hypothetical protein